MRGELQGVGGKVAATRIRLQAEHAPTGDTPADLCAPAQKGKKGVGDAAPTLGGYKAGLPPLTRLTNQTPRASRLSFAKFDSSCCIVLSFS